MTTSEDLQPGMTIRVLEARPVAQGIITYIEEGGAINVVDPNGQEVLFSRGDMPPIDEYLIEVLAQPGPVPPEPPLNTHWLGQDGVVYSHFHSDWNHRPWVGNGMWDLTWPEVYWRARPLVQVVIPEEPDRID